MRQILILDELYHLREHPWKSILKDYDFHIIVDPQYDFSKLRDKRSIQVLGFSSSFFNWTLPNSFLDMFPNLKAICLSGGWHEHIDLQYCKRRKIIVTNVPEFASLSSAEWCLMASLILARNIPLFMKNADLLPEKLPGIELEGKIAGIVGMGGVGKKLVRLACSLGMRCIYWSRKTRDPNYLFMELDELLKNADIIYLTFYEADSMAGFLGKERLSLLKASAFLVSGLGSQPQFKSKVVDWDFAIQMVQKGKLAGLAIEIGEGEKVPKINGNIYITSGHAGWCTKEAIHRGTAIWIKNILGIFDGSSPNIVLGMEEEREGH